MPKDMQGIMDEWKNGQLHSGSPSGKVVTNRKQAIAIGLSEQRQQGKSVPPKKESVPGMMQTRQDLRAMRTSTLPKGKRRG